MTAPHVRVVDSLGDLEGNWDELVDSCRCTSPFVRSWWVVGMGCGKGTKLRMPLVFEQEELIGGIPLVADRLEGVLPRLRSIDGSDYTDIVAPPNREIEVVEALRRWLQNQRTVIDIACAVPGSQAISLVPFPRWIVSQEPSPYELLPSTYTEYEDALSARWRANVRSARRMAERKRWTVRCVDRSEIEGAFERLVDLHRLQWPHSSFGSMQERLMRTIGAGAARGELHIYELVEDDAVLASQIWFHVGGCVSYYQGGRRPDVQNAGSLLIAAAIEHGIESGQQRMDLLGGGTPYKAHWARQASCLRYVRGATGRLFPLVIAAMATRRDWVRWSRGEPPEPSSWPPRDSLGS